MSATVKDVLLRAAEIIEPEGAWTQGWYARDVNGDQVFALEPAACTWCMAGALRKAIAETVSPDTRGFYILMRDVNDAAFPIIGGGPLGVWNDAPERTQAEVVAVLREAAERAQ